MSLLYRPRISQFMKDMVMTNYQAPGLQFHTDCETPAIFDPSWIFSDTSVMTAYWGDGSVPQNHATALSHTYAAGLGRKVARFTCPDWTKLTDLDLNGDVCALGFPSLSACTNLGSLSVQTNQFSGILPSFSSCTLLTFIWIAANEFTGTMPSFAACTGLTSFLAYDNLFSGTIPSFAACTALTQWVCHVNQFTGYAAGGFATQKDLATINLQWNSLTEAAVDAILADCVTSLAIPARVVCTLTLSGGNATPSAAGIANHLTLEAAGWTVDIS